MAGQISEEMLYVLKADITDFLKKQKEVEDALARTGKSGMGTQASVMRKELGKIQSYYDAIGNSAGSYGEKVSYLQGNIRALTDKGLAPGSKAVKAFSTELTNLGKNTSFSQKFGGVIDAFTGGGFTKATSMLGSMGGAFSGMAAMAGPAAIAVVGVKVAIDALKFAWQNAIGPGIAFNAMLEQQEVGFRVMLGSAEKASDLMDELKQLSLSTPIGFQEGATSAKQLIAYGFAADEVTSSIKMLGTVAAATGTRVGDLTYVYGTLRAQGRAYTRDLMQFGMRGIPIFEYLGKTLNRDTQEIRKMTEAGQIGFKEVEIAMQAMTGSGGRFNNMLEESMNTVQGQTTVLKNTWTLFTGELTKAMTPAITGMLKDLVATLKDFMPYTKYIGMWLAATAITLGLIVKYIKTMADMYRIFEFMVRATLELFIKLTRRAIEVIDGIVKGISKMSAGMWAVLTPVRNLIKLLAQMLKLIDDANSKAGGKRTAQVIVDPVLNNKGVKEYIKNLGNLIKKGTMGAEAYIDGGGFLTLDPQVIIDAQKRLMEIDKTAAYSWQDTMDAVILQTGLKMEDSVYNSLLMAGEEFATDFWNLWDKVASPESMTGLGDFYEQGKTAVIEYTKQWDDQIIAAKKMQEQGKASAAQTQSEIERISGSAYDTMYSGLVAFMAKAGDPKTYTGQTKVFWDEMNRRMAEYEVLAKGAGATASDSLSGASDEMKGISSDILAYMKFRADAMNAENSTLTDMLTNYVGMNVALGDETQYLERQLALINYQYAVERESTLNAFLEGKLTGKQLEVKMAITTEMEKQANIQARLAEGQRLYNKQLEGNPDYWKNLQSGMGYAADKQDYASYAGGAAISATQGTNVGSMIAGGDPITMIIMELAKALAGLENFSQVLNFAGTIAAGFADFLVQADEAFKPLVDVLYLIGASLGPVIAPILEHVGVLLSEMAMAFMPLIDISAQLMEAFMPVIMALLKIINPLFMFFDILSDLMGINSEELELRRKQIEDLKKMYDKEIASLQDLYQAGAISGKQYEDMLAALKGNLATATTQGDEGSMSGFIKVMNQLAEFIMNVIYPLLKLTLLPIAALLGGIIGAVTWAFEMIALGLSKLGELLKAPINAVIWGINQVIGGINAVMQGIDDAFLGAQSYRVPYIPYLSTGTDNLTKDMIIQAHQGEMVVPKTFADAIRRGDLSLGGKQGGGGTTVVNNYYIEGSVLTERDFYKKTGNEFTKLRKQGYA